MTLRLGYACINMSLDLLTSRTAVVKTILGQPARQAVAMLRGLALQNIRDLIEILRWNVEHGIRFFRITSNLFPHMGNRALGGEIRSQYFQGNIDFALPALAEVGRYARDNGIRLTFHSNPYCHLGSENPTVLYNTLFDLGIYARIVAAMGVRDSCVILHGGGVYGDKHTTLVRIEKQMRALPLPIRRLIVFENDERHYNPMDLLPLCERLNVPFCFDVFHNAISADSVKVDRAFIAQVCATWIRRGLVPKFHLSEQERHGRFGAHSEYVQEIPAWMFRIARSIGYPYVDLMIEAKGKDLAVMRLRRRYGRAVI